MKIENISLSQKEIERLQGLKKKEVINYLKEKGIGSGIETKRSNIILNKHYERIKTYRVSK